MLNEYLKDKLVILKQYIANLLTQQSKELTDIDKLSDKNKFDSNLTAKIITSVGINFIYSICLCHFLIVYTYQNTESDNNYSSLVVSIKIGKRCIISILII